MLPIGNAYLFNLRSIPVPGGLVLTAFIVGIALLNLIRMALYVLGASLFSVTRARSARRARPYQPTVSLVVPVHNESVVIERTLDGLLNLDYAELQIILADDGSTDDTLARIYAYKREHDPDDVLEVFAQRPNGGKAHVLNSAIKSRATGDLVMCLDGDSVLAPDAVRKAVAHFRDPRVVALSSNVNILPNGRLLGLVQRYEYLICHQMKKAHNVFNVEYIIGGIGSMFRRSLLDEVGYYDTNTMTEDIDLTLKIIARKGSRGRSIAFAHDSVAYTEAVPSFRSLIRQRYRWKYGRMQTFYKNHRLFFSREEKHAARLSWFFLPFALWQEIMYLIEPLVVTVVVAVTIYFHSPQTLLSAVVVMSGYAIFNIVMTAHLPLRDKVFLSLIAPLMYVFLYILSVVEYLALLKSIVRLPGLRRSISGDKVTWSSPERNGQLKGGRHRAERVAA